VRGLGGGGSEWGGVVEQRVVAVWMGCGGDEIKGGWLGVGETGVSKGGG